MAYIWGRGYVFQKKQLILVALWSLAFLAASQDTSESQNDFRTDINTLKFISDETALVQQSMELRYLYSVEDGGFKENRFEGKIWTASHPDQFFINWYLRKLSSWSN